MLSALIAPPLAAILRAADGEGQSAGILVNPLSSNTCPWPLRNVTTSGKRASARRPRRVVVAMSGGVDSSVVAALLKQQGHDVIGVTLQLYDHGEAVGRRGTCCAGQDIHDARRVADRLGIAHYVLDYEQRFKATVMQSFADSYAAGETPIPCVVCNQQIKFHELLATVRELEADTLATGHYIELRQGPAGPELYRARDAERDQSYFLFATTRAQLDWLSFPARRLSQGRGARAGAQLRAAGRRQVRQPGHLLRAPGPLHQRDRAPQARRRRVRRHRARRRPRARPARRHHQLHHRPARAVWASRARRRCTSSASMPRPGRSWSGRARACTRTGSPLGT